MNRVSLLGFMVIAIALGSSVTHVEAAPCGDGTLKERVACLTKRLGDLESEVKVLRHSMPTAAPVGQATTPKAKEVQGDKGNAESKRKNEKHAGPTPMHPGGQPLTKAECEKASKRWNDNANVCD